MNEEMNTLKESLKNHGWTISALAEKMNVLQPSLSRMVQNKTITLAKLEEIASIIDCPITELLQQDESSHTIICPHCNKPIEIEIKVK